MAFFFVCRIACKYNIYYLYCKYGKEESKVDDVLKYENLVYSIIHNYDRIYDFDDLYQVGMLGLVEAYNNFDDSLNVKFSTYAYYFILGEVTSYIRESKSVKLSKDIIRIKKSINQAIDIMTQKLGRNPTNQELSLFLDIEEDKIDEAMLVTQNVQSLDYVYDDDNDLYNVFSCEEGINEELIDLRDELKRLTPEEHELIIDRYFNGLTQTEISKKRGETQVQVSRRESKILQKLKRRIA